MNARPWFDRLQTSKIRRRFLKRLRTEPQSVWGPTHPRAKGKGSKVIKKKKKMAHTLKETLYTWQFSSHVFCLYWGFTSQSTQWGHVERGQFTYPHVYWADLSL